MKRWRVSTVASRFATQALATRGKAALTAFLHRIGLPLRERRFVVLAIGCIVVTRLFVILHTSWTANLEDPLIYQSTGQAVLAGVNPYDFADKPDLRQVLRKQIERSARDSIVSTDRPMTSIFTDSQEHWDFYVSSNLPASTVMYGVFEKVASGSRFAWRLLFILGDIMIFVALTNAVYLGGLVVMRLPIGAVPVVASKVDPAVALLLACAYSIALATARPASSPVKSPLRVVQAD